MQHFPIHQSCIKTLLTLRIPTPPPSTGANHLIITTGDDNALAFTLLQPSSSSLGQEDQPFKRDTLIIRASHAASITSACVVASPLEDTTCTRGDVDELLRWRIASGGNDQRIHIWEVTLDPLSISAEGMEVKKVGRFFTCVADVGGMDSFTLEKSVREGRNEGDDAEAERGKGEKGLYIVVCGVGIDIRKIATD